MHRNSLPGTLTLSQHSQNKRSRALRQRSDSPKRHRRLFLEQLENRALLTVLLMGAPDSYTVDEDQTLTVAAAGVLANDPDATSTSTAQFISKGNSTAIINLASNGGFTYKPPANFFGTDTFQYQLIDGSLASNFITVTITVASVNDSPVAVADAFEMDEDPPGSEMDVLANDTDADGDTLSVVLITGVSHGGVILQSDGKFNYTPDANYHGTDSFTYQTTDGTLTSIIETVVLTVLPVNDVPVIGEQWLEMIEGGTISFSLTGFDADGDSLQYSIVNQPEFGVISGTLPDLSYTPTPGAPLESFTFTASDDVATSQPAIVYIDVQAIPNSAPEFTLEGATGPPPDLVTYEFAISVDATGTVGSVTADDADSDPLVFSDDSNLFDLSQLGEIVLASNAFVMPGSYVFVGTVTDDHYNSDSCEITIVVTQPATELQIETIQDAVEGDTIGRFRIFRTTAVGDLDLTLDLAPIDTSGQVVAADYTLAIDGQQLGAWPVIVSFDNGELEVFLEVIAAEDYVDEGIEDLYVQIVQQYAVGTGYINLANVAIIASMLVQDAGVPVAEWKQVDDTTTYRALKDSASLENLATMVTGVDRDWTAIWPIIVGDGGEYWKQGPNDDWNTAAKKGAKADVSNLVATTGIVLYLFQKLPGVDPFLGGMRRWMAGNIADARMTLGANAVFKEATSNADVAKIIQTTSLQGKTPILRIIYVGHWGQATVPDAVMNWDANAEVDLNSNDFAHAKLRKSPIRSWFTRNAVVGLLGCDTSNYAERIAEEYLPVGASARGTTAWLGVNARAERVGFDLNGNHLPDAAEMTLATVAELEADDHWSTFDGEQ